MMPYKCRVHARNLFVTAGLENTGIACQRYYCTIYTLIHTHTCVGIRNFNTIGAFMRANFEVKTVSLVKNIFLSSLNEF